MPLPRDMLQGQAEVPQGVKGKTNNTLFTDMYSTLLFTWQSLLSSECNSQGCRGVSISAEARQQV